MTQIERTKIETIKANLDQLKIYRDKLKCIDNMLKALEQLGEDPQGLELKKLQPRFSYNYNGQSYYHVALTRGAQHVALLLSRDFWQQQIPPLEKWLDDHNIQHTDPEKQ